MPKKRVYKHPATGEDIIILPNGNSYIDNEEKYSSKSILPEIRLTRRTVEEAKAYIEKSFHD
jgi:hypothetical protein